MRAPQRELTTQIGAVVHDLPVLLTAPLYRTWHQRWGATETEITAPMPGDTRLPHAQFQATRAITIDAPPSAVWPWLTQVGCLRAGWYSNIDEAKAVGDDERAAQADAEREFLVKELARAFGFGGRARPAASAAERARVGVTGAVRQAMSRIAEHHPALGEHLDRTIRTGAYCAYVPDPRASGGWTV